MASKSVKDVLKMAMKELPDEATVEQFIAYIEAEDQKQKAIEGTASKAPDDAPPAETAASIAPTDATKLADTPPPDESTQLAGEGDSAAGLEALALLKQSLNTEDNAAVLEWLRAHTGDLAQIGGDTATTPTAESTFSRRLADGTITILKQQVEALKTRLSAIDAEAQKKKDEEAQAAAEARFQALLAEGNAQHGEKDLFVKLARTDPDELERHIKARGQVVPVGAITRTGHNLARGGSKPAMNTEDAELEARDDIERSLLGKFHSRAGQLKALRLYRDKSSRASA